MDAGARVDRSAARTRGSGASDEQGQPQGPDAQELAEARLNFAMLMARSVIDSGYILAGPSARDRPNQARIRAIRPFSESNPITDRQVGRSKLLIRRIPIGRVPTHFVTLAVTLPFAITDH